MTYSYNKLWKLLIDKWLNKQELIKLSGISTSSIAKLTKGQNITIDVLCKICKALNCDFGDIMEIEKNKGDQKWRNHNLEKADYLNYCATA